MAATGVKKRHRDYDKFASKWRRCRDVSSGQDEIYAGGILYLHPLTDETPEDHRKRLTRTPFYNATWRTISGFIGMLFRKPPILEVSDKLAKLLEDVTMSGVSFKVFVQDVTLEDLEVSRVGILVDHPKAALRPDGKPLSIAEAETLGLRPSMSLYKAESIINWEYITVNNKTVLGQVRLLEEYREKKSEFEFEDKVRIRVLDLVQGKYRVRLFDEDTEEQIDGDIFPLMNGQTLSEIPFYFVGPDGTEGTVEPPVLIDLVDLNLKHFQVSADYENACHFVGSPTPYITGYRSQTLDAAGNPINDKFYIGSTHAWVFPDPSTQVGFLELTGDLGAIEKNLDRKEAQMAAIGARMLAPDKAGVEAEGSLIIRNASENSILAAIAIAVSGGATKALKTFAAWAGEDNSKLKFEINRDFIPLNIDPGTLTAWIAAVQAGRMSAETFFNLIKRGDLVDPDLTFEDEQARIDATPPPPALPEPIGKPEKEDEDEEDEDEV